MWRPRAILQVVTVVALLLIAGLFIHRKLSQRVKEPLANPAVRFFKNTDIETEKLIPKVTTKSQSIHKDEGKDKEVLAKKPRIKIEGKDKEVLTKKPRIKIDNKGTYQLKLEGMNTKERSEFQQKQVDKFCELYNMTDRKLAAQSYGALDRHLLVNKKAETLYCYAPKVGCTNLKIAFFVSQGKLKQELVDVAPHTLVPDMKISKVVHSNDYHSVKGANRTHYIEEFFKFVMYRHPLERLASAYRDKINRGMDQYSAFRKKIYKYAHPDEPAKDHGKNTTFSDFITFWINHNVTEEHFAPIFDICQPCRVRYSYYGQFKTFQRHAAVLLDRIDAKSKYLLEDYYTDQNQRTKFITQQLYDEVPDQDKRAVLKKLSHDIDFYYHIYPDEVDTHKEILNLPDELTVPY